MRRPKMIRVELSWEVGGKPQSDTEGVRKELSYIKLLNKSIMEVGDIRNNGQGQRILDDTYTADVSV